MARICEEANVTRGHAALIDRLRDEAIAIARARHLLAHHRRMRNLLIEKARCAGFTVREIEKHAGVSNVRVSQLRKRDGK